MPNKLLSILLALIYISGLKAQPLPIQDEQWQWNHPLVAVEDIPADQTAVYDITGKTLTVGPWIAGKTDVRLVLRQSLPVQEGSVRGRFRTDDLYPREGNIWITYKKGNRTLTETNYWFGQSQRWQSFCFPVLPPPPGCDRIELSFGFHMKTPGRLQLRDLTFGSPIDMDPSKAKKPKLQRKAIPTDIPSGQKVRLAQNGNSWWLVDAQGKPFFSMGCAMYGNSHSPRESWSTLSTMAFNTIANGSNLEQWMAFNEEQRRDAAPTVFQFYRVNTEVGRKYDCLVDRDGLHPGETEKPEADVGGFNHAFPDPFDPRWEEDARQQVRRVAQQFRDKPYFMAWMAANERSHWNLYRYVWSPGCAREFDRYLRQRYSSIRQLNQAWGTQYTSFEQIQEERPEPLVIRGAKYEDFNNFSRVILRTFNQKILRIIHEEDPGRLVFTNRFMIHEVRGVFDNLDLYKGFDGIAVNIYPSNNQWGLNQGERQYLQLMHTLTGLPLMICEWSVPAIDSHLYDNPERLDWSYPQVMKTQQQRALQSACVLTDLCNMPYVVGAHWFTWGDFNGTRQSNRGLFSSEGTPWSQVQEALDEVNRAVSRASSAK